MTGKAQSGNERGKASFLKKEAKSFFELGRACFGAPAQIQRSFCAAFF
jgi:hypothetical protein